MSEDENAQNWAEFGKISAVAPPKKGVPARQIIPGAVFTLSHHKATRDRSWTGIVWKVLACSGDSFMLERIWPHNEFRPERAIAYYADHEWYEAGDMLSFTDDA